MRIAITGGSGFIGVNLVDYLIHKQIEFINIDIQPPPKSEHQNYWEKCDILNKKELMDVFLHFKPQHVIHLAAKTDVKKEYTLDDYRANTEGTHNVLQAINNTSSIERVVVTSTQFVHQSDRLPSSDTDYVPYTVYGESKVITEQLTRKAELQCIWTIIRPTNIWGPWHPRYDKEFLFILRKGLYFHPGTGNVIRSFGYVGNVVYQIMRILELPGDRVNQKVLYLGDEPINLLDWVNGFSNKIVGHNVCVIPSFIIRTLSFLGDVLALVRIKFPITSSRFKSMTTDNPAPMEMTSKLLGASPFTMQEGIEQTYSWLLEQNPKFWSRQQCKSKN